MDPTLHRLKLLHCSKNKKQNYKKAPFMLIISVFLAVFLAKASAQTMNLLCKTPTYF